MYWEDIVAWVAGIVGVGCIVALPIVSYYENKEYNNKRQICHDKEGIYVDGACFNPEAFNEEYYQMFSK